MDADSYRRSTMTAEEQARHDEVFGALARSTRELVEAQLLTEDGHTRAHGNAVIGLRNAVAPPLRVERTPDGKAWSSFHLGPQYEGPPGLVHGGVSALLLDQLCGEAAAAGGSPGMTGRLTLHYRRPTPLGDLSGEAWIDHVEGYKTTVKGHLKDADGNPTVEAEGLFILPRWARELIAEREEKRPDRFE
jgi:acyl-coenzyme A thioesterase PaaI-like protein